MINTADPRYSQANMPTSIATGVQPMTANVASQLSELRERLSSAHKSLGALDCRLFGHSGGETDASVHPVPNGQAGEIAQQLSDIVSQAIDLSILAQRLDSRI